MVHELMTPSGLLLRRDAIEVGYDDNHLARLVRDGQLVRARQGAYVDSARWNEADLRRRHLLRAEAVSRQYGDGIAFSHDTAALRLGGPDHGLDLQEVHVTHFDGGGRRVAGVAHHSGTLRVLDASRQGGDWITSPTRTVLDVATTRGLTTGVVLADDFIRRGLTSTAQLEVLYESMARWPGSLTVRLAIALATGKSESVGESLGYLLFRNLRLPRPEQQFEVFFPDGRLAGRTDWAWPDHGVLGEFDGKVKYLRLRRPGESVTDAVLREKRREDLLRELTGMQMIRFIHADYSRPTAVDRRLRAILRLTAA